MDKKSKISEYRRAITKATNWLLMQQLEDGSLIENERGAYYYRLMWTFGAVGEISGATRLLAWFRKNIWEKEGFTPDNVGELRKVFAYTISNIAIGTHILGAYDISYGCLDILKKCEYPNGGIANSTAELQHVGWQENWITAQAGMAYLFAGDLRSAVKSAQFIIDVWDRQQELPNKLYYCVDPKTNNLVMESDAPDISYILNARENRQCFWVPGLIAAFLGQMYLATKNLKYLDYAFKHQDFVQNCTERQFDGIEVCKTGFGAAILYQITKEKRFYDWAIRVGDYFVRTQRDDGCWPDDRFNPSTVAKDIAITDQQALWLHYIVAALSD